jgi:hypothetical protein
MSANFYRLLADGVSSSTGGRSPFAAYEVEPGIAEFTPAVSTALRA